MDKSVNLNLEQVKEKLLKLDSSLSMRVCIKHIKQDILYNLEVINEDKILVYAGENNDENQGVKFELTMENGVWHIADITN